jgi:hypothetical protein
MSQIARLPRRRFRNAAAVVCVGIALSACGGEGDEVLLVDASIDGRPLASATAGDPVPLRPTRESVLTLAIENPSAEPVEVKRVRIEGDMLSIDFLTYDVRVRTVLAPGARRTLEVPLDFFDLERQATGYLRANLRLYDADRTRVSDNEFAVDIRGSLLSTMGVFAMALLFLTGLTTLRAVRDAKRRLLPENRFQRGLRFLVPGLGLGLLLSVGFSILRIFPLPAIGWVPLTLVPAAIGFAIGYVLTKAPDTEPAEEDEADLEDQELADLTR